MRKMFRSAGRVLALFFLGISALLAGCGDQQDPTDKAGESANIKLEVVKLEQWESALKEQVGKIVVVDTWATW